MKRSLTFLAGALLIAALSACSTVQSRIQANAAEYNQLDPQTQAKISHGDVDIGFTPGMVYMALGQPDERRQSVSTAGQTETWIYRTYYGDDFAAGAPGYPYRYHRWYTYYPHAHYYRFYWEPYFPGDDEVAVDDIRVTFQNGRVVNIDQVKS